MSWLGQAGEMTEALRATGDIGATDALASEMLGLYVEAGYDIMPHLMADTDQQLLPFFRYEYINTQSKMPDGYVANDKYEQDIYTVGINYKPISQVVLKVDYRQFNPTSGDSSDYVNFGAGFIF